MMVSGSIWWIHFLAVPNSVTVKHMQLARLVTWRRSIWSLKVSRWSWGSVLPLYFAIVGILKRQWCLLDLRAERPNWCRLMNSVFLAANFLNLGLSSFISSFIGETTGTFSLFLEVAKVCLASRCVRISSPLLRPSQSKTLRDGLRASSVISLSRDLTIASGLVVRPDSVMF